ncbi:hypothetical protein H8B15_12775 [Hymenobacter sp. BT507]|uniref:Uncharacterized protein n=1 Tax=Hymenobacter citatus TaxID=2763506 RepID=A0ABR7ML43_9BACT|nr:hypothetical protein [Hymenobacter citatus]MBC6611801.1 hypothetical protein [Hymenobacter citatus]
MTRWFAVFLTALVLLQTFSQELRVVDYQLHKERITKLFCVNKARPQLHCNGKCHLAKQLRKAADEEGKAPNGAVVKLKFEALPLLRVHVARQVFYAVVSRRFAPRRAVHYTFSPEHGIFHPPSFWA